MKSIYFVAVVAISSLFTTGCGDDRSQGLNSLSSFGKVQEIKWIYDTREGKKMIENNFVYIPGGFDVDGDGVDEGGFWLSQYEARADGGNSNIDINQNQILNSFKLYNPLTKRYDNTIDKKYISIFDNMGLEGITQKIKFDDSGNIVTNITPAEASTMIEISQIDGGIPFSFVSAKQYKHLLMLANQNKVNSENKDSKVVEIANSLFEEKYDSNVPKDYKVKIYNLLDGNKEWTSNTTLMVPQSPDADFNLVESYAVTAMSFRKLGNGNIEPKSTLYDLDYRDINIAIRSASDYLY